MLEYKRIGFWEGIDINKSSKSKECMLCHYWYFKDIGFNFEPRVCNGCPDILMMAYQLKNIAILNVKRVDYRCVLWEVTKNDAINMLGNSISDDKGTLWIWILVQIKSPVEVIKEGAFGGTYFRDIYSGANGKWHRKSWKKFDELGDIDQKIILQIIVVLVLINWCQMWNIVKISGKKKVTLIL